MTSVQEEKISMSFKVPSILHQKINEKVIADGYGMHGKSRWLQEAIEELLALSDFAELVSLSETGKKVDSVVSVRLPRTLILRIENSILAIRKQYPYLEGVKSKIARTAIFQRLIRN